MGLMTKPDGEDAEGGQQLRDPDPRWERTCGRWRRRSSRKPRSRTDSSKFAPTAPATDDPTAGGCHAPPGHRASRLRSSGARKVSVKDSSARNDTAAAAMIDEGRAVVVVGAVDQPGRDQRAQPADDAEGDVVAQRDHRAAHLRSARSRPSGRAGNRRRRRPTARSPVGPTAPSQGQRCASAKTTATPRRRRRPWRPSGPAGGRCDRTARPSPASAAAAAPWRSC